MKNALYVQDWSPRMSFILKGSQVLALQLKSWFKSKNIEMEYKTHIKLAHELHGTWFLVQCEELRINHLTPLLVATMPYACWFLWWADYIEDFKWRLHFQSRVAFWRVILREVYFKGPKSCLKGIQDFNLEHWTHWIAPRACFPSWEPWAWNDCRQGSQGMPYNTNGFIETFEGRILLGQRLWGIDPLIKNLKVGRAFWVLPIVQ